MGDFMYQGFYINLDRASKRRIQLEQQLAEAGLAERYSRFAAIDGARISYGPDARPGSPVLGCTLSHLSVVKHQLDSGTHLHILEDDAVLHRDVARVFDCFANHDQVQEWDVFMTDIFLPPDVYLFKYLHHKYKESAATGSISFLDIGGWEFAGATSYFVNEKSKKRFLQLMEHGFPAETPYDLRMRALAKNRMLKIYTCFPFYSTLSASSSDSTIAGSFEPVLPLSEYRRSFYIEPELERINRNLSSSITAKPDLHDQIYLNLVRALMGSKYTSF